MTTATPSFECAGHVWPLRVTPPLARRIRDEIGIDLYAVTAAPAANPFVRMADDPYLLSEVLWSICKPLAQQRAIDRDTFETALWESVDAASEALLAGVVASFPEKKREALQKLLVAQTAAMNRVIERLGPKMDELLDAAIDELVESAVRKSPSTRTNSPAAC